MSYTPLPLAYAYLPLDGRPIVFVDGRKLTAASRRALGRHAEIREPDDLEGFVDSLGREARRVAFDAATAPAHLTQVIERAGGKAELKPDPITLMKAVKNPVELQGARAAHERDGAAMARFLAWFAVEAPRGGLSEIDAVKALETFRRENRALRDISFPTIAGAGANSAIPHYRVSESSNRKIERGIFLIDSGAQYEDGTTDITRTIAVGRPTSLMRDRFTRVLKGHIAVARAVFPPGTSGAQIDALARMALWRTGLDFDHGTGHGVGSYLSVHEGPQRLAKTGHDRARAGHDRIQRARLLCGRRIWHPDRESGRGRDADDCGRRAADAGFRDADAGADRSCARRTEIIGRGRDRVARRLPRAGAEDLGAPRRRLDSPLACAVRRGGSQVFGRALPRAEPPLRRVGDRRVQADERAFRIAELRRAISPWHRLRLLHDRRRVFQPRELGVDVLDLKLEDCGAIGGGLGASRTE